MSQIWTNFKDIRYTSNFIPIYFFKPKRVTVSIHIATGNRLSLFHLVSKMITIPIQIDYGPNTIQSYRINWMIMIYLKFKLSTNNSQYTVFRHTNDTKNRGKSIKKNDFKSNIFSECDNYVNRKNQITFLFNDCFLSPSMIKSNCAHVATK